MADFGIYWKNFARESKGGDWPCTRWFSNSDRLGRAATGDWLWLFTAGAKCDMAEAHAGYFVEIFTLQSVQDNQLLDPDYPAGDFHYVLQGEPSRCFKVDPPLFVDPIIRAADQDSSISIGTFMQSPRRLPEEVRSQLLQRMRSDRPELLARIEA